MQKNTFEMYEKINLPCLVVNTSDKVIFSNTAFISIFSNISSIKIFQHNFNFEVCLLDVFDIKNYNPLKAAIDSKEDFSAYITYQNKKNDLLKFELTAFKQNELTVLMFKDVTMNIKSDFLQLKYDNLLKDYGKIEKIHKKNLKLEQAAKEQAIKIALIHKISTQIRNFTQIHDIINTALKELVLITGGFKAFYTQINKEENDLIISHIYPEDYKKLLNTKIKIDLNLEKKISKQTFSIEQTCKDFSDTENIYQTPITEIIIPINTSTTSLGVIFIFSKQKLEINKIKDIPEAISLQLASAIVQASLFKQLNDKNKELETTLQELKETQLQLINSEKMASLGLLIAGVAHEINTPLGSINANNTLINKLIKKFEPSVNTSYNNYLDMLKNINNIDKEAISRITQIVKSLKKFVRLDEAELQEADINSELDLTLDLIRHETKNKIQIIKNYGNIPKIKCFPNMLNQAFMNILVNACQSIKGKGSITISTDFIEEKLIVKIKDSGSGMDDSILKNIFNLGFTTKRIGIGTGLGLAITRKIIIEKHNGLIDVKSKLNEGTEFIIKIPTLQGT